MTDRLSSSEANNRLDALMREAAALQLSVVQLRAAIEQALACTPSVRDGQIIYDCGDPWDLLRSVL